MAFRLTQKPTYQAPVEVWMPNNKGGFTVEKFTAVFRQCVMTHVDENDTRPLIDELRNLPQAEVMRQVLTNVIDLLDDDDAQVQFNEATLNALLAIPQALHGLSESFWSSIFRAPEKNSN
ncbi:hypothetical protein [Methylobacillus flagellatus]|uniref:hypothetical protein n=1 Tax=Methylobacillus flagellatus TaxID=405 RepID=UPI0010F947D0|nr:hypothetical protein [Methylobacillus flagellatus]